MEKFNGGSRIESMIGARTGVWDETGWKGDGMGWDRTEMERDSEL